MKVLQIIPELNVGGVERGSLDLARELLRRKHQALVISNGGSLVKELEAEGVGHICLPVHKKSLFTIINTIPKVARVLRDEKIDIVHARSRVPALIAFFACRKSAVTFVTTAHGYYNRHFFSRVMGWGSTVIVASEAIAQHMINDFGVPEERIKLIPRGVDLQRFYFLPKPEKTEFFTIAVIGRLTPIKGHKYFLQALAKVVRALPRVKALIVGDGKEKYKEELKILTRRLGLDKYVEFLGHCPDVNQIYNRINALVMPSVTPEAFGRVIIEAGATGVPTIATKVGGVVDIIEDGINGILVAPEDPLSLSAAIIRLAQEPKLAQRLAVAARKRVEQRFSLQQMSEETIKVYAQLQASLKILVIKLSALGDIILVMPSLGALREKFPQAQITVLTNPAFKVILEHCPYIDRLIELEMADRSWKELWRMSGILRRMDFQLVIDLQNNRLSHILAYLSACPRRYGYDNGKLSFLLNHKIKEDSSLLSPIDHQGRTLKLLGVELLKKDLELWPQKQDQAWADTFLQDLKWDKSTPLVGINLGASPQWPSKRWGVEKFSALIEKLQRLGAQVIVTGTVPEQILVEQLRCLYPEQFLNAVGKTQVMQLACLIQRCNVYVTSDSAPLHMAYAMNTPVVALFGPTDPRRHAVQNSSQIVINKNLSCSPCYRRRCHKHDCLLQISVEEVFTAVKTLLI